MFFEGRHFVDQSIFVGGGCLIVMGEDVCLRNDVWDLGFGKIGQGKCMTGSIISIWRLGMGRMFGGSLHGDWRRCVVVGGYNVAIHGINAWS